MADETKNPIQGEVDFKAKGFTLSIPAAIIVALIPLVGQAFISCNTGNGALKEQIDRQGQDMKEIKDMVRQQGVDVKAMNEKQIKDAQEVSNRVLFLEFKVGQNHPTDPHP